MTGNRARKSKVPNVEEMLGPLEAEVMKIIWVRGTALVSEVEEILNEAPDRAACLQDGAHHLHTPRRKGNSSHEKEGRAFRFYPTMTESEFVAAQASRPRRVVEPLRGCRALDLRRPCRG